MLERLHPADPDLDDLFLQVGRDGIEIDGKLLLCQAKSVDPIGYVFGTPETPATRTIPTPEIWRMYRLRELRFVTPDELFLPPKLRELLRRTLGAFNARERGNIVTRMSFVQAVHLAGMDLPCSEAAWQPIVTRVAVELGKEAPHWTTVHRWSLLWLKGGKDHRVLAGLDREKGNRERKLTPLQLKAIEAGLGTFLSPWRVRPGTVHSAVNAEVLKAYKDKHPGAPELEAPLVGYKTIWAECKKIKREVKLHHRDGAKAAREGITPVYEGVETRFPFERVECDFKYVGMFVVDGETGLPLGTPYLMAGIDRYSGAVAGYDLAFDPPGAVSAARCLRHIIEPKDLSRYGDDGTGQSLLRNGWPMTGVPANFIVDNDPAFISEHFAMAAKALGSNIVWLRPATPQEKGAIESFWKSLQESYLDPFPGKTLRLWSKPNEAYDPSEFATLTLADLHKLIGKSIVDIHNRTMDLRSGEMRIERWSRGVAKYPPRLPRQHEDLIELVGCYAERIASVDGIRIFGLRYNSDRLAKYRADFEADPQVEVRYTPDDLKEVWLVDKKLGSFPIACTSQGYADGLTLHQHRVIRQHHVNKGSAGRIYRRHLMIAKAELLALGQKMLGQKSSRNFRQQLARYFGADPKLVVEAQQRLFDAEKSRQTYAAEMATADDADDEEVMGDEEDIRDAHPLVGSASSDTEGAPIEALSEGPVMSVEEPSVDSPRRRPDTAPNGEHPWGAASQGADPVPVPAAMDPAPAPASAASEWTSAGETQVPKVDAAGRSRTEGQQKRKVRFGGGFQRAGN